jgi:hypothetical protein
VTPFARPISVEPGKHALEFRNEFYDPVLKEIEVAAGETRRVHIELHKRRR